MSVASREEIARDWLPRYTGMPGEKFAKLVLLTNFDNYLERFAERFKVPVCGKGGPMQAATSGHGITMINFGIGSPNAAVRGEGTGLDYYPIEVPALPSFRLHDFVGHELVRRGQDYRTGVVYTTNHRVWEWDESFRGALLLVSDTPMAPAGIKIRESDREVSRKYLDLHLEIGIATMESLLESEETVKHLRY